MATIVFHREVLAGMMAPGGDIGRAANRVAGRIRDRAKLKAPVDTGLLRNSITSSISSFSPKGVTYRIGTDVFYGRYQELGTGPRIYPKHSPVLVFQVGGRTVFARSVRGVRAKHFLLRAAEESSALDFYG